MVAILEYILKFVNTLCEEISLCLFHIIFFLFGWAFFVQEENLLGICSNFRDFCSERQAGFPFLSYLLFLCFIILFVLFNCIYFGSLLFWGWR